MNFYLYFYFDGYKNHFVWVYEIFFVVVVENFYSNIHLKERERERNSTPFTRRYLWALWLFFVELYSYNDDEDDDEKSTTYFTFFFE